MFIVSHSTTVEVSRESVWSLWQDVGNWPKWDQDLISSELVGSFRNGDKVRMVPKAGPPFEITFTSVREGEQFSNEADLGFAAIKTNHIMQEYKGKIKITHEITITPRGEEAQKIVAERLWPSISAGLAPAVEKLAELAQDIYEAALKEVAPPAKKKKELEISESTSCFIGVVSKSHASIGYEGGFTQACHGKKSPLSRMKEGDWFAQYSPKMELNGSTKCQKITYIGRVVNGEVYQHDMGGGFKPYRIDIDYISSDKARETSIAPLIDKLSFIKNKSSWGATFRYGFLKIPAKDFKIIYSAMVDKVSEETSTKKRKR